MNLITVDANAIFIVAMMIGLIFSNPTLIIVAMALIIYEVGWVGVLTPFVFLIAAFF